MSRPRDSLRDMICVLVKQCDGVYICQSHMAAYGLSIFKRCLNVRYASIVQETHFLANPKRQNNNCTRHAHKFPPDSHFHQEGLGNALRRHRTDSRDAGALALRSDALALPVQVQVWVAPRQCRRAAAGVRPDAAVNLRPAQLL